MVKTILLDCRFAAVHAGLGRYTRELVTHLLARQPSGLSHKLLVRDVQEDWIPTGADVIAAPIPHYSIAEQIMLPRIIRASGADVFFSPHFNVPFRCPIPFVVTVHDLILHRYPNHASWLKQMLYRRVFGHAVANAASIIAVSNFTARELSDVYGSSVTGKIQEISEGVSDAYHPISAEEARNIVEKYNIYHPYFLYVGNAKQHKNLPVLLAAFKQAQLPDCDLVLVTGGKEIHTLELPPHVHLLSGIPDADLPALYTAARAFVTPSLYEGYCLPVAEALACGCPVIASNRAAIPETAAGHAMLMEPTADAFAAALQSPPTEREPFVGGSWEKAAEETERLLIQIHAPSYRQAGSSPRVVKLY